MITRDPSKVTHVDGLDYCDICNYCIDGQDVCSNTCAFVVVRNLAQQKREPLVQEVIKRFEEYRGNPTDAGPLMSALVALAEWKPT